MTRSPPHIVTLGCRLNAYESEVMRAHARAQALENAVIVNTCAVTGEAVRQARQAIRKAKRERPDADIIVTGCAAQVDPAMFAEMPEVARVIGNHAKMKAETWAPATLLSSQGKVQTDDIMSVRETAAHLIDGMDGRARAHVQIQNGCDHRCTFCIIPYGRGNARSVPAGVVVDQVKSLVDSGHYEVVLTGVDLTSWGTDLPGSPPLGNLVQRILKLVPDLPRLRLSSIDAIEIDQALFEAVTGDPRIAPYLHVSLQHGADLILKRMKRRHSRGEAISLCQRIKAARPEVAFGADLIAGFPTETEAHFADSLSLIEACRLAFVHAFPYSPRPGTPAARMPQLEKALIKERARRLREAGAAALRRHLDKHVRTRSHALVERGGKGRLADFTPIVLASQTALEAGRPVPVEITGHDGERLAGTAMT